MTNKLTKLEALRGSAALYVVFHHLFAKGLIISGKDLSFLFRFGQEAVIIFFLLSGFVIQMSYMRSKDKTFKTYFAKRFLRIYIPLFLVFLSDFLLTSYEKQQWISINYAELAGNLFMLQDVSALKPNVIVSPFLGNTPLWSLSYEWWFYMLFFAITVCLRKYSSDFVYLLSILSAITYLLLPFFVNRELMYLGLWWVGADIGKLYTNRTGFTLQNLKKPLIFLLTVCAILSVNVFVLHHPDFSKTGIYPFLEFRHFAFSLVAVLFALLWRKAHWKGFRQTIGHFEFLAPISFGLYITHYFMIAQATYLEPVTAKPIVKYIIYFSVCFAMAYFIERVLYVKLSQLFLYKKKTDTSLLPL